MAIKRQKRVLVLKRDRYGCVVCGWTNDQLQAARDANVNTAILTMGHLIPTSRGGTNAIENLQAECNRCNSAKGNALPHELPPPLARTWRDPAPLRYGKKADKGVGKIPGWMTPSFASDRTPKRLPAVVVGSPARPMDQIILDVELERHHPRTKEPRARAN
jgi:hypothetical protein